MKIVFFGTGEFSTIVLKGLVENGHNVVAVVSQPDKINARNNKIIFSSIKQYCIEKNIPLLQFAKLNYYNMYRIFFYRNLLHFFPKRCIMYSQLNKTGACIQAERKV